MHITKEEAIKFEEELKADGYTKYIQHYKNEDYLYWKSFAKTVDEDGHKSGGYSVGFAFWDWSKYPQFTEEKCIGIQNEFMLGTHENISRLDVSISDDKITREEFEEFCKEFYEFYSNTKQNYTHEEKE
jgi:hypothetical protein